MVARKHGSREAQVRAKVERLRAGAAPRVVDLFSGCGGFSLGFQRAGCEIIAGVELDPHAAASHELNFHLKPHGRTVPDDANYARDITQISAAARLRELGHPETGETVDFLIGGPPCPAFARVGRAKLRDVRQHAQAFLLDERAQLFRPYLQWVEDLLPVAVVMENVPDFLNFGGENLAEVICHRLEDLGYRPAYTLLNAANFGVAQMRERFVLLAYHHVVGQEPSFPTPTHHVEFPQGYTGARNVAFKTLADRTSRHFRPSPSVDHLDPRADAAVTVGQALGDLAPITGHLDGTLRRGRRSLAEASPSAQNASHWVKNHMRVWPGHEAPAGPTAHVIRSLSFRDYRLFARMAAGDEYPQAYAMALRLFDEFSVDLAAAGGHFPEGDAAGAELGALLAEAVVAGGDFSTSQRARLERLVGVVDQQRVALSATLESLGDKWAGIDRLPSLRESLVAFDCACARLVPPTSVPAMREWLAESQQLADRQRRWLEKRASWVGSLKDLGHEPHLALPSLELEPVLLGKEALDAALKALAESTMPFHLPAVVSEAASWARQVALVEMSHRAGVFLHLKDAFVPPYDPMKFPNKWRKMSPDEPARTLMAHLGKDSYSHIHYDSDQARTISVREAARLQSFPDGFTFCGSMNAGFRQVGNAVPPLLAWKIGLAVRSGINGDGGR